MFTWVHTCPRRDSVVEATLASIRESDLSRVEVWRHPDHLAKSEEIEEWWEQRLLLASVESEFFLRLEDDVLVSRQIEKSILNWGALKEPDFGIGSVYLWKHAPNNSSAINRDGKHTFFECGLPLYAPGIVFKSEVVVSLVKEMWEIRRNPEIWFSRRGLLNLDTVLFDAASRLGLKCYLHEPSLVDCRPVESANIPGTTPDYQALNFEE